MKRTFSQFPFPGIEHPNSILSVEKSILTISFPREGFAMHFFKRAKWTGLEEVSR
jgi:hypothetical protein